jgi:glycyl-tRNA synthetase beta chain
MREENVRHDFISAAFEQGLDSDLVRLLARVRALQSFVETPEGADLLAGYKRAANILKKEGWNGEPIIMADDQGIPQTGEEDPLVLADDPLLGDAIAAFNRPNENSLSYTPAPEESALIAALDSAEPRARAAVEAEDFEGAMAALATLRAPVDAFFDKVTVNDPDPAKRAARLNLLARMRDAVHQVADFSRIEG